VESSYWVGAFSGSSRPKRPASGLCHPVDELSLSMRAFVRRGRRVREWQRVAVITLVLIFGVALWGLRQAGTARQAAPNGVSAATPTPHAVAPPTMNTGWRLRFDAQFTGSQLDTSIWATCYPWADAPSGCTNFGNSEYEWYLPSQDRVTDGALRLVAQRILTPGRTSDGTQKEYFCRSGMVTSYTSFNFKYGYLQIVAKIPSGYGLWPALWLAPTNLRSPTDEIDIIEHWGPPFEHTAAYLHPLRGTRISAPLAPGFSGWHTFGLFWTRSQLVWFVDGHAILSTQQHVPRQPMYFIANLADYRSAQTGRGCDGTLLIRSVSIWQR
jgi:beta-glucanase (GH16 family)